MYVHLHYSKTSELLRFCLYGKSLWDFCIYQIQSKDRLSIWNILCFLSHKLSTSKVLKYLEEYVEEISKMNLINLDKLCLNIIYTSKYNIATSLYLAGFMNIRSKHDLSREEEFQKLKEKYTQKQTFNFSFSSCESAS